VPYEDLQDPTASVLARVQGPRRLPHADALGGRERRTAASPSKAKPWLPVVAEHLPLAVDRQEDDPGRFCITTGAPSPFATRIPALAKGELNDMHATNSVLHFVRRQEDGEVIFCAFNLGDHDAEMAALEQGKWSGIGEELGARRRTRTAW
jgi:hypothetical protein